MTHEECLNVILSHSCSSPSETKPGFNEYRIGLHCAGFVVTAKVTGESYEDQSGNKVFRFEIDSIQED